MSFMIWRAASRQQTDLLVSVRRLLPSVRPRRLSIHLIIQSVLTIRILRSSLCLWSSLLCGSLPWLLRDTRLIATSRRSSLLGGGGFWCCWFLGCRCLLHRSRFLCGLLGLDRSLSAFVRVQEDKKAHSPWARRIDYHHHHHRTWTHRKTCWRPLSIECIRAKTVGRRMDARLCVKWSIVKFL